MRLDIHCQDRPGMTQEILNSIGCQGWDLRALEMVSKKIFVHFDPLGANFNQVSTLLHSTAGVKQVVEIDLLPSELKRKHLDALLSKLPDPLLDIDMCGTILVANSAAQRAFERDKDQIAGCNITELIAVPLARLLPNDGECFEVCCANKQYLMDISPVRTHETTTGAVIVLRSPQRLGQQMSAIGHQPDTNIESMVGQCHQMKLIGQQTIRFAQLDLPVLVVGETGTGKELLARALHDAGPRAKAPFLAINCASLAENLLESELFGYAPGAFTGAKRGGKPGLFELAEAGTIFLDEIGEMSVYLQAKLLRFLQELSFRRIGGSREINVNVRIVCATHRDLNTMMEQGSFREDLFYRLNVLSLSLPPLRQRSEDIPALIERFCLNAAHQINISPPHFSNEAIALLKKAPWPGNIRQLQNVIFRTLALTDRTTITPQELCLSQFTNESPVPLADVKSISSLEHALGQYEKELLAKLYKDYPSTRKLAERLGVSNATISRKLAKHGLN